LRKRELDPGKPICFPGFFNVKIMAKLSGRSRDLGIGPADLAESYEKLLAERAVLDESGLDERRARS
jgi:hypothetical protein